jgi:hypothetical protein
MKPFLLPTVAIKGMVIGYCHNFCFVAIDAYIATTYGNSATIFPRGNLHLLPQF